MSAGRRRRPNRFTLPEVSLTPLIDTALCLLIIFMVAAPMMKNGIGVALPEGQVKEGGGQQELVVSADKNGALYFNSYPVEQVKLAGEIRRVMGNKVDSPIYLHADQCLSCGKVIEVLDELKQANFKHVVISTKAKAVAQQAAGA
jgi:biopolymer transport protein TolR